jgi:hypothetical protein
MAFGISTLIPRELYVLIPFSILYPLFDSGLISIPLEFLNSSTEDTVLVRLYGEDGTLIPVKVMP